MPARPEQKAVVTWLEPEALRRLDALVLLRDISRAELLRQLIDEATRQTPPATKPQPIMECHQ